MNIKSEKELIRALVNKKVMRTEDVNNVFEHKSSYGVSIIRALIEKAYIDEERLYEFIADFTKIPYINHVMENKPADVCLDMVPAKIAHRYTIVPLSHEKKRLTIAISNPFDIHMIDDIKTVINCKMSYVLAKEKDILASIDLFYGVGAQTIESMTHAVKEVAITVPQGEEKIDDISEEASIVAFVNKLLWDAYKARATDIHVEPFARDIKVRYRIDGVLQDVSVPKNIKQFQSNLISRFKILANLDITEHRLPQDGRIRITMHDGKLDLRISIIPTPFGETVSIRMLSSTALLTLSSLGFDDEQKNLLDHYIHQSHGIIFLCGPTGSGKTSTLYACLDTINNRDKKIITIEDPIEYQIEGITQVQIHPKIGLTFAHGLRSFLRHDPDVIMVGEVRDGETASIAIRASLTGHLVFTTLHTNDAVGTVTRLIDMGLEPYLVSSSVSFIISQRLVRVLCDCKKTRHYTAEELRILGFENVTDEHLYDKNGCPNCNNTGYIKRTVIAEMLPVTDQLRTLIIKGAEISEMRILAKQQGMISLRENGWGKIKQGITTIEEVLRVTEGDE